MLGCRSSKPPKNPKILACVLTFEAVVQISVRFCLSAEVQREGIPERLQAQSNR